MARNLSERDWYEQDTDFFFPYKRVGVGWETLPIFVAHRPQGDTDFFQVTGFSASDGHWVSQAIFSSPSEFFLVQEFLEIQM